MSHYSMGLIALAGAATLSACVATTTPETDARLGLASDMMRAQQTLNPEASRNADPVLGVDGRAAKGALDNYRDSFRKPPAEGSAPIFGSIMPGASGAR